MIDSKRIIIITGLVHSGTTILMHTLMQHPDISVDVGDMGWTLEGPMIYQADTDGIEKRLKECNILLMKLAYQEGMDIDWIKEKLHKAKVIHLIKSFDEMQQSWDKPTNLAGNDLKTGTVEYRRDYYNFAINKLSSMYKNMSNMEISYSDFIQFPKEIMNKILLLNGLNDYEFDLSMIGGPDIKFHLGRPEEF